MTTLLRVQDLNASYGPLHVLRDLSFHVDAGEVVVILGANGAGKTTTLRALCGMVSTRGSVELEGRSIVGFATDVVARLGVAHVPQGRGTVVDLSVEDNLLLGAIARRDNDIRTDIDQWYETFPVLAERRHNLAGGLSGGEQQMLAVARALMLRPRILLLDEPSLGLAPLIVDELFSELRRINTEFGVTMLVVEQNADMALDLGQRGYVLEAGEIVLSGSSLELRGDDAIRRAYLGY